MRMQSLIMTKRGNWFQSLLSPLANVRTLSIYRFLELPLDCISMNSSFKSYSQIAGQP